MSRISWVCLIFALWAALYAASFIVAHFTEPTGDSFTRGLNRLMVFFQFQIAAAVAAAMAWWAGRAFEKGTWQRWLSRMPVFLALLLFLLIVGLIAFINLDKPNPDSGEYVPDPDRPVTAPADNQ